MESGGSSMPTGIMPAGTGSGMLGLEMPLHHHPPQQHQQQQLFHNHPQQQHQFLPFPSLQPQETVDNPQQSVRHTYTTTVGGGTSRSKQQVQQSSLSNEEEPTGYSDDAAAAAAAETAKRASQSPSSASLWQRMKWTDSMIRLLIKVVYCVGDDAGGAAAEGGDHQPPPLVGAKGKKGSSSSCLLASAGLLQQKKGKWKSVSRAMMERGYYVSPQQCEDKFNDLNKRYKRVNDLLGRGTACRVVENPSLLDSMDHLTPKAKEETRKLLNSKHLFFREMCAYHNSSGPSSCAQTSNTTFLASRQQPPAGDQAQQQRCFHHSSNTVVCRDKANAVLKVADDEGTLADEEDEEHEEDHDSDHDDEDEHDYNDDDDDDQDDDDDHDDHYDEFPSNKHQPHCHHHHHQQQQQKFDQEGDEHEDNKGRFASALAATYSAGAKRPKRSLHMLSSSLASPSLALSMSMSSPASSSTSMQHLRSELMGMVAGGGGVQQQRQWLRRRVVELEEKRVGLQCRAFELERQRFKWLRFSSNKEREMEMSKLENERLRLENERMLLLLRQKDMEIFSGSNDPVAFPNTGNAQQQEQLSNAANTKRSAEFQ